LISTSVEQYAGILLFIMGSIAFCMLIYFVWSTLKPHRPNPEKLSSYECGEEAEGSGWYGFNVRFYRIALFFILFEVEVILLYPWALAYSDGTSILQWGKAWSSFLLMELIVFMVLLLGGLLYIWKKGYLDWDMEKPQTEQQESPVPLALYEKVNEKYKSA
jgi:NADH-quinone oxidoreductase subunit A